MTTLLRIKECQGFDNQTNTAIIWFEVWLKLPTGDIVKKTVSNLSELETA
jgi:hypothetical protein